MAYDTHRADPPVETAVYEDFGLKARFVERIVTGGVIAGAIFIVALIAVLMGMD